MSSVSDDLCTTNTLYATASPANSNTIPCGYRCAPTSTEMGMTDPEMHEDVAKRVDPKLLEHEGPLLSVQEIKAIAGDDEDAEIVLRRVQARKTLEALHWQPNFRGESFSGLSIRLERGKLGLNRDEVKA
ncbi:hypothetical protein C8F01DRAFT_376271 [Mycena amicta]|nr:hypothetical protein C8F01DRAFT_376271 [Mycena amicta]